MPLTNYDTAQICRCYQNGRYFYKTHLATVHMSTIRTYTGNLEKIWGGQTGRQAKIWECMAHPCPPLESLLPLSSSECVIVYVHCYRIKYDFILFKKMTALHLPTASLGYASKISCIASGRWYAVPGSERQLKRCMKISIKIATSSNSWLHVIISFLFFDRIERTSNSEVITMQNNELSLFKVSSSLWVWCSVLLLIETSCRPPRWQQIFTLIMKGIIWSIWIRNLHLTLALCFLTASKRCC